jgi:hypothetical protein
MNKMNACEKLRDLYQEIKDSHHLEVDLDVFSMEALARIEKGISERYSFLQRYQAEVEKLLSDWAGEGLSGRIEIDDEGRVKIEGNLNLRKHPLSYFPALIKSVSGELDLRGTSINRIDYLEEVGFLNVRQMHELFSLDSLKKAGRIDLQETTVKELPKLEEVGKLDAAVSKLESLPALRKAGTLYLVWSEIREIPLLTSCYLNLDVSQCKNLQELPQLEFVGEKLTISNSGVESMPNLTEVGYGIDMTNVVFDHFSNTFPSLASIGHRYGGKHVGNVLFYSEPFFEKQIKHQVESKRLNINGQIALIN